MIVRLILLIGISALFSVLAALGAYLNGADQGLILVVFIAMGICLVPAVGTLIATELAAQDRPEMLGIAFLGGTLIRMVVVTALALILSQHVELVRRQSSWLTWVVVCYLLVLAVETTLLVVGRKNPTV